MNWIDLLTGMTLMNAMPHFILGVWKSKMLSGFGTGNWQNILWGLFNFLISIGLFIYNYGLSGFKAHAFYTGACAILIVFFCTSWFWRWYFYDRKR